MSTYLLGNKTQAGVYTFGKMHGRGYFREYWGKNHIIEANGAVYVPFNLVWRYKEEICSKLDLQYTERLGVFFGRFTSSLAYKNHIKDGLMKEPERKYVRFFRPLIKADPVTGEKRMIVSHSLLFDPREDHRNYKHGDIVYITDAQY